MDLSHPAWPFFADDHRQFAAALARWGELLKARAAVALDGRRVHE